MYAHSQFLSQLQHQVSAAFQRVGVVISGDSDWQDQVINEFHQYQQHQTWFCMGDWQWADDYCVSVKQGHMLLGRECEVLLFDARQGFDANSFSAAIGSLVGGGILIIIVPTQTSNDPAQQWLKAQWDKLIVLEQHRPIPSVPAFSSAARPTKYLQQLDAIAAIEKVITGHRKRPLVLTADRGRGKSSALGIASANLLVKKPLRILVTAPSLKAVEPVFVHASRGTKDGHRIRKDRLDVGQGSLQFVAPDELLNRLPECDLLLVDEAAAIPVPLLKRITEHYHRLVFSSTVNGYEGCGRGFTLKFVDWLKANRPGMHVCHLKQPIRWSETDHLEAWSYDAFLLDAEIRQSSLELSGQIQLTKMDKQQLIASPMLLRECFALLVNAHYQTSPNDLLHLLQDERSHMWVAKDQHHIVGVMLTVEEGDLDDDIICDIAIGKRRPRGHLTPITIVNQLGYPQVGRLSTLRIMRIAVHPSLHRHGVGQSMLKLLEATLDSHISYLSTSFGATDELIQFWLKAGYQPIRLGTTRDAASGCYSLLMVRQTEDQQQVWIDEASALMHEQLSRSVIQTYPKIEASLYRRLLQSPSRTDKLHPNKLTLIHNYCQGGGSYESVLLWLQQWLLQSGLDSTSDLLISKVFLNHDWAMCAKQFQLAGRKQVEQRLRSEIKQRLKQIYTVKGVS